MTLRQIRKEYEIISKYKGEIEKIPNYKQYFLLDGIDICSPNKLTNQDLVNYKEKCTLFQKNKINKRNINENLQQLLVLNMPDGGIDIGDFIYGQPASEEIVATNNALIDLLHYGILPMNKLHIYHCDVKESNVLIVPTKGKKGRPSFKTRLIDWGLAVKYNPTVEKKIPSSLFGVPFQYNLPFSNVLFNDTLEEMYAKMLMDSPSPRYETVYNFVQDYIISWMEQRGPGHFKTISQILVQLGTEPSDFLEKRKKHAQKEENVDLEDRGGKDRVDK
jgi:serine/threonine protein kinase